LLPPLDSRAARDSLTNALTRPTFMSLLGDCAAAALDAPIPFSVVVLDVDQLTNVNDRHGFGAGDRVLAGIARRVLAELARERWAGTECAIARYDGDALILLAKPADLRRGAELAEALRAAVARKPLEGTHVTVSAGVAEHRPGESLDELLARMERALHLAKQSGRDRVEVSPAPARAERAATVIPFRRP